MFRAEIRSVPVAHEAGLSSHVSMAIARERQVFIGLMVIAGAGLMVDRALLGPKSAAAGVEGSAEPAAMADASAAVREVVGRASAATIATMFERFGSQGLEGLNFGPEAAWTDREVLGAVIDVPTSPQVGMTIEPPADPAVARFKLSLVMPTQTGGVAVVNGVRMQLGQWHPDGFQLIHVGERSVVLEVDGKSVTVNLPRTGG